MSNRNESSRPDGHVQDGATRVLARFVAGLRYEHLPAEVTAKAKACVLDAIGCMLFGSKLPWTRIVADAAREQGGAPQAVMIGTGERTSVAQAVLVNATAGHGFELDDAHTRASMHAGSVTVSAALALSEWLGNVEGDDFLAAIVAGYEAGLRVGIAAAGNLFKQGFHSAAVCGVFAGAATAAYLLRLNEDQTQHAFGIAGSLAGGLMAAQEGAMVKRLHAGQAARNGVYGALLARRGFTGIPNVLEAPFGGFFSAMTARHEADALTAGLGTRWETLAVGFKPYATAGAIHAALMLLDTIMREERLAGDDIDRIDVQCTTYCRNHVGWPYVPQGVASAQMNLYYALAAMALDRAAMVEQFTEERLGDPRLLAFIPRIHVSTSPEFDTMGNAYRYATRLRVATRAGTSFGRETLYRPGSAESPLNADALHRKFRTLASHALDDPAVEKLRAVIANLDRPACLQELITPLAAARA